MEHVRGEERPVSAGKEADEYQRTFYIWSTGDRRAIRRRRRLRANGVQLQKVVRGFTALQSGRLCFAQTCCCACLLLVFFFGLKYLLRCD